MFRHHKRRKIVYKVTKDTFHKNLLLGLIDTLKGFPFVSEINLIEEPPTPSLQIQYWQYFNGVFLPKDLRDFYLSTNGLDLTYRINYLPNNKDENNESSNIYMGKIHINKLQSLNKIEEFELPLSALSTLQQLASKINAFTLDVIDENTEVILVYMNTYQQPYVWLYKKQSNFYYLSSDFSSYLRMSIAYLGIPGWQKTILPFENNRNTFDILRIFVPTIFERELNYYQDTLNIIDSSIFEDESWDEDSISASNVLSFQSLSKSVESSKDRIESPYSNNNRNYYSLKQNKKKVAKKTTKRHCLKLPLYVGNKKLKC